MSTEPVDPSEAHALRELAKRKIWTIDELPPEIDIDMLRCLDANEWVEARYITMYNQQKFPGDKTLSAPQASDWVSPIKNRHIMGDWEIVARAKRRTIDEPPNEIHLTERGRAALARLLRNRSFETPQIPSNFQSQSNNSPQPQNGYSMKKSQDSLVFISYSHADKKWLQQLQTHLQPHIRNGSFTVWDDTKIKPGTLWREEITDALNKAKVAVLLVSPAFLASDFIASNELPPLLEASRTKGLKILWIPVCDSAYQITEIAKYQSAYPTNRSIKSLRANRDKAWVEICTTISAAMNS